MKRISGLAVACLLLACPLRAGAQTMEHMHHDGMTMPPDAAAPKADAPTPAPAPQIDHTADAYYDAAAMAKARAALVEETGHVTTSMIRLDRLEYQARKGGNGYAWEGEGWFGGDIDALEIKSEGDGGVHGPLDRAELQGRWRHALDPWFNLGIGVRQDFRPQPRRTYAVIAIDGLAPYWFDVEGQIFLSDKGDLSARLETSYDLRLTQRWILQPRAELNLTAQAVPALHDGAGLTEAELGLRLRYEIAPEFAPYVGVNWDRKIGDSATFARASGEHASAVSLVTGVRFWF
jgi:copper resistance protein B